eukprot:UN02309
MIVFSGTLFKLYYANPTFEKWQYKINPVYPKTADVAGEIYHMLKGCWIGVTMPALSLSLSANGYLKGYCGTPYGIGWEIFMFFFIMMFSDLFEWYYHKLGHTTKFFWEQHKSHHKFYNPTPFSVIADDLFDQLMRSTPLLIIPTLLSTNMDT